MITKTRQFLTENQRSLPMISGSVVHRNASFCSKYRISVCSFSHAGSTAIPLSSNSVLAVLEARRRVATSLAMCSATTEKHGKGADLMGQSAAVFTSCCSCLCCCGNRPVSRTNSPCITSLCNRTRLLGMYGKQNHLHLLRDTLDCIRSSSVSYQSIRWIDRGGAVHLDCIHLLGMKLVQ